MVRDGGVSHRSSQRDRVHLARTVRKTDADAMGNTDELVSIADALKDPAVKEDPYPLYREFQRRARFVPTVYGGLLVTHHTDCFAMLRDNRFSSSNRHEAGYQQFRELARQVGFSDLFEMMERVMLF